MAKKRKIKQESIELEIRQEAKAHRQGRSALNLHANDEDKIGENPSKLKAEKGMSSLSQPPASTAQQVGWAESASPSASERVLRNSELVGIICQFISLSKGGTPDLPPTGDSFQQLPLISREWTSLFVPLVRVHKVFWNAASDVLWRCMDGVEPFLRILQPSLWRHNSIPGSVKFHDRTTPWQWERFKAYSAKRRILTFSGTCPRMDPAWITFLEAAKPPEISWFPKVQHIFLLSNESLPVFLTMSIAHQLKFLHVAGEAGSSVELEPILGAVSLKTPSLSCLQAVSLSLSALLRVQHIKTLTSLSITIPRKAGVEHLRHSIGNLKALTTLEIRRRSDTSGQKPKKRKKHSPLATETGVNDALCRSSSLENLRTLRVDADVIVQDLVAATLSPHSLESLQIVVTPADAAYIVQSLTVHLQRNTMLTSLTLRVAEEGNVECADAPPCVGDAEDILDIDTIFEEIRLLRNLRHLYLEGLPIARHSRSAKDFAKVVLPDLKMLEELTFLPLINRRPLIKRRGKKLPLPRLESLMKIAMHNERLVNLNMAFSLPKKAPDLSPKYASKHGLRSLSIQRTSRYQDIDEEQELGAVIDIARFLDIVFPHLENVTVDHPGLELSSGYRLWDQIQKFVSINQEMRRGERRR